MAKAKLKKKRGKFVVLYGANNIGKSEQTRQLSLRIQKKGLDVLTLKYPLYELPPTGPEIFAILRDPVLKKRNIDETTFQTMYAKNRRDFQPTLIQVLNSGITVVAEDYKGTGLAWGMTKGVELKVLEEINKDLISSDCAIWLDGKRFLQGKEKNHRNEDKGDEVWVKNRKVHKILARKYNWKYVNANQSIKEVHENIWKIVNPIIDKKHISQLKII